MSNISHRSQITMEYIQHVLLQISIPYVIFVSVIGIVGNVVTIVMLSKRSLTKNFNNCTLIALATADLLFNLALVSRCLNDLMKLNSYNFCRLLSFVSHLAELLSACFTVHFTVQRFIAVKFPLSVFIEKKNHFVHYFIVALFIIFGISYCLVLIHKNNYESCEEELHLHWFLSDAFTSFALPFTIIAVLNLLIIFHLRKNSRDNEGLSLTNRAKRNSAVLNLKRKSLSSNESTSQIKSFEITSIPVIKASKFQFSTYGEPRDQFLTVGILPQRTPSIRSTTRAHAQSHRVTRMLILVSTCFLLLNAPSHICSITLKIYSLKKSQLISSSYQNYLNTTNNVNRTSLGQLDYSIFNYTLTMASKGNQSIINRNFVLILYVAMIITQHISYLSYSINFFLYSFCGMKFRRELAKYLARYGKQRRNTQTSRIITG